MEQVIPNVKLGEFGYEGNITLSAWGEFNTNRVFRLDIGGDMVQDDPKILSEHIDAYYYLIENQKDIKEEIINTLYKEYPRIKDSYGYEDDEASSFMPDIKRPENLLGLIRLNKLHIMNVSKDGIAYVGFEFHCSWDEDHGLGIMTHKKRVIKVGGSDTSFLTWIAEEDLG